MFKIAKKDLKLFLKDRRSVMLTFILPIFLITIFSLAFGGAKREAAKPSVLMVSDLDTSSASMQLVAALDSLKSIEVEIIKLDSAQELVRKGKEDAVLVLHRGFEDSVTNGGGLPVELQYDPVKEMEIGILQQALVSTLMGTSGQQSAKSRVMKRIEMDYADMDSSALAAIKTQVIKNFSQNGESNQGPIIKMSPLVKEKENSPGVVQAVAGTAVMMLLFSVAGIGGGLLEEKEEGTLKKLLYAPMNPNNILFGKLLTSIVTAVVQLIVMFAFTSFVFNLDLTKNVPGLVIMVLATAFACSGFGIFLASIARSRQQLQGLSTLVVLTMSAIGGSMIPTFIMPAWMQKVSVLSVNYWSIQGFYDVFWRERPFMEIAVKALVLIAIGAALCILSMRLYRRNILKLM
jgi:ABC-2 type transport system permease protein